MKLKFQTQYFKNILVTLVLYKKQLHFSSQTPACGIYSAPGLYHEFLEGIHNSPNDVLLLSSKVNRIQQNSTQWAAILQCIIIVVISHPKIKHVFTFNFNNNNKKPHLSPPNKKHLRKDLRRRLLIFKQLFIFVV